MSESKVINPVLNVGRNMLLIVIGALLIAFSVKGVMVPHSFLTSGFFGTAIYIFYATHTLSPAIWFLILSIPVVFIAWRSVGPCFCVYTLISMILASVFTEYIPWTLHIENPILAAVAGGVLNGAGTGITLRSQGSDGGLSILGVVLHRKFGMRIGHVSLVYNVLLFSLSLLTTLSVDQILYSIIGIFVSASTIDYIVSMFNQRKLAFVITDVPEAISQRIFTDLRRGVTFLSGRGAFTGTEKKIILTVVHNYQIKRLEDVVASVDPAAFLIIADTFNVIGTGFSKPKNNKMWTANRQ